jgi:hypothetical protein
MKNITPEINFGIESLVSFLYEDYNRFCEMAGINGRVKSAHSFSVDTSGRNYWRVVSNDSTQRFSIAFIVVKESKGFKIGDILKSAGWKAPATNYKRGNILDRDFSNVTWAGCV